MVRFRGFRLVTEILQVPVEKILAKVQRFATDDATIVSPTGAVIIAEADCRAHSQTSPEWEHQWCREHVRPEHELPRQWCGHRAVAAHQRLTAAEAENHRLDLLVVQLTKALDLASEPREPSSSLKNTNATGSTDLVRPVVDRPLHWSQMPVREVQVYRRRRLSPTGLAQLAPTCVLRKR
jgi:hypothetical protein